MNFWFEMAVNAVDVTLILSFLVQYFGYKTETSAKYWGTALIWILLHYSVFLMDALV